MRHFEISSSSFEAMEQDFMKIEANRSMIGQANGGKITKFGEFTPSALTNLNFRTIGG